MAMKVVVAGGTGFLGRPLVEALRGASHEVAVLTRGAPRHPGEVQWQPQSPGGDWVRAVDGAHAVINLAGQPIADRRWSDSRKRTLLSSRLETTAALARAIRTAGAPPSTFLSASGIGVYGTSRDESLDETAATGDDFLARLCGQWEAAALDASPMTRVVLLRTGLVLARDGGALPQIALPFRLFIGGRMGTGRQVMSWIHLDDWIALVLWAMSNASASGPLNLTAPNPVSNSEFSATLGRVLHRPSFIAAPAFALRLALGEMADAMLLGGQRAVPAAALRGGFAFRYPTLEPALKEIYSRRP